MSQIRAIRAVLASLAAVGVATAGAFFVAKLDDPDSKIDGTVALFVAVLAGVLALAWFATYLVGKFAPTAAAPAPDLVPDPPAAVTAIPSEPEHRPRIALTRPPDCDEPTVTLDKPKGRSPIPRPRPVVPEWDYGRQTLQLRKTNGVLVGAGPEVRALADLVEIDTMAGETLCVNDESAVDPEAAAALRRIARRLRREEP